MLRVASTWKVSVVGCDQPRAKYCAKNVSIIEVEGRSVIQPHRLLPKKISSLLTRPRNIHLFTFQDLPVEHCSPPTSDLRSTQHIFDLRVPVHHAVNNTNNIQKQAH